MADLPALSIEPTFRATRMGLRIIGIPDQEAWAAYGRGLAAIAKAMQWVIGDWLVFGENHYGETYAQAVEETGLAPQTLMNMRWVASRVEISRRRENLSFAKHAEVAAMEPGEQDQWLDRTEAEDWNSAELREALRESRGAPRLHRVAFTEAELVALNLWLDGEGTPDGAALTTACIKITEARLAI